MNAVLLDLLVGAALLVAAVGILVPILPGTLLAGAALLIWAMVTGGAAAWTSFGLIVVVLAIGQLLKFLLPHRSLTAAGVPGRSILVGGLAAIVGFFLIPVLGMVLGFVGGLYVAEQLRLGDWEEARSSTWSAMKATGFSILIELSALMVAAMVWAATLVYLAGT